MPSPKELVRPNIDKLLERSLAANKRRALIQMATGSGKTYTAVNFVYRLIKLAGARRVLFLVDRGNLGDQTLKENPLKRSDLDDFESPAARSPSLRVACYNPKHDRGIFSSGWRSRLMMATCFSFSCALDVFPSCCCFATAAVFAATP